MALSRITPVAASTPPPRAERFLRGQRPRGAQARLAGRSLLRGAVLALGVTGLLTGFFWVVSAAGQTPELAVNRVLVEGNAQLSDGEILELLDLSEKANILFLDLRETRTKLLRSAWVREVEIERVLPATITLRITERVPVAVAVLDELYLLAADGTILDQLSPQYRVDGLVLARGLADGSGVVKERAALAGRLAATLVSDDRFALLVSEIDVGDGAASVVLRLREPPVTVLIDAERMVERLRQVVPLLGGLHERYPSLDVVDLRFQGRIYLRLKQAAEKRDARALALGAATSVPAGGASF